jgi:hypothetical protein
MTPEVEDLFHRWQSYRCGGGESLTQMAFWVLSALQVAAGGRRPAARLLAVEFDILSKLGELTTNRGDAATARKVIPGGPQELTARESQWIEEVVRRLVIRYGEWSAGATLIPITWKDLPPP